MALRRLVVFLALVLPVAYGQAPSLTAGKILVASRDLADPNFSESVILLVNFDEDSGALGLIVNRRSEVAVGRVLRDLKQARGRSEPVYLGGPVESEGILAVLRSPSSLSDAKHIFGDVYLVSTRALLEKTLTDNVDASRFHVYLGYAGWGPGQLEHEIEIGSWRVVPSDASTVFDSDPESLWPRLIRKTETRIASLGSSEFGSQQPLQNAPRLCPEVVDLDAR